jgi:CBS domain-containing membrane protein
MLAKITREFLLRLWPARAQVDWREQVRAFAGAGAGVGILATALLARWWAGSAHSASPWLAAPLGASAVLVFAVPASPLAQPWAVVGGNFFSALVGIACAWLIPDKAWAGAVAVALAIGLMFPLRCLHPPGGATALLAALGAPPWSFAFFPMLADSVALVTAGMLYNSLTGRRYPHGQQATQRPAATPAASSSSSPGLASGGSRFSEADLDTALAHYNQVLDVSRDDLGELLHFAEAAAYERNFGHLQCRDIMSREPLAVPFGTPLAEAWALMRERHIKALPITDRSRRVVGIVTVADFLEHAGIEQPTGIGQRLRSLMRSNASSHSSKPETVGQIMTRGVRVASADRPVAELVPLFSERGHHHIPIIDSERRLVGIITQSDLVRALYRATQPQG